jgi:hypothetical protein
LIVNSREYWNALKCGTRGRGLSGLGAPVEIAWARLRYGLGPRLYSLFRLWRKPLGEWRDYIDDNEALPLLRALNPVGYRDLLNDKIAFFKRCRESNLPTVPVLAVIAAPASSGTGIREVHSSEELDELLALYPDGLFIKPWGGSHGDGAFAVLRDGSLFRYRGVRGSSRQLLDYCRECAESSSMLLVQPRVRAAASLQSVMSNHGLGTVRAITSAHGENAKLIAACLRIPVGTAEADNFLQGASGNLAAPIDVTTGRLGGALGSARKDWPEIVPIERHPDTNCAIAGFELPYWRELVETVLRGQRAFSGLGTIGWDVALSDNGPILVEGNCAYAFDLLQFTHDRGFRPTLEALLASRA